MLRSGPLPSSPAGESSVERALDGGRVPLMRERAKEVADLNKPQRRGTFVDWILPTPRLGFCTGAW